MTMYLLIKPSEDGDPITELVPDRLQNLLDHPEQWNVREWLSDAAHSWDTNYWRDGVAVLLKAEIVVPVPASGFRLPGDQTEEVDR